MIGKIAPLVQGRSSGFYLLIAHSLGGLVGGAIAGLFFGWIALVLRPLLAVTSPDGLVAGAAGALLITSGLIDFRVLPNPHKATRQTPASWICTAGRWWGIFGWGLDLALGWTTRAPSATAVTLPLIAVLLGMPLAFFMLLTYGFMRAATVCVLVAARTRSAPELCTAVNARSDLFAGSIGGLSILVGVGILIPLVA